MTNIKKKAVKGLVWSSVEHFSAMAIQFVLGIILARLLLPKDYGLLGMLAIFWAIADTFINSGFSTALIRKKNRDDKDFSTVFYFNIVVATVFYLLLFLIAPLIADFYNQPILTSLTRVIGLTIVINSFAVVQRAKLTIKIDFKTQTKASVFSVVLSGGAGIYFAFKGYGVWALVIQTLVRTIISVALLWYYSKWLPRAGFHLDRFKSLFSFGSKLLTSGILDTLYNNVYLLIIGKMFSAQNLGFYTRARQFSDLPSMNLTQILHRVSFPILSEIQDDAMKLRDTYRKLIMLSTLIIFPLMMGLAALAEPMIRILLTEKWINTAWMLQMLCFAGMLFPIHSLNLNILNVKGRSDLFLRLEVAKKILVTIILIFTVPFGIKALIIGQVVTPYLGLIINTYYSKRIIDYGFWQQMRDLSKVFVLSIAMFIIIYFTISFIQTDILKLITGFIEGVIFYIAIAWLLNIGEIRYLPTLIKKI